MRIVRYAYYGLVNYPDDLVGRLLAVLDKTGWAESTVIVFTIDQGDMLGERGLWYKKCFFEGSARVPLMIYAPGSDSHHVSENVSLVDLLPTFVEMATDKSPEALVHIESRNLYLIGHQQ